MFECKMVYRKKEVVITLNDKVGNEEREENLRGLTVLNLVFRLSFSCHICRLWICSTFHETSVMHSKPFSPSNYNESTLNLAVFTFIAQVSSCISSCLKNTKNREFYNRNSIPNILQPCCSFTHTKSKCCKHMLNYTNSSTFHYDNCSLKSPILHYFLAQFSSLTIYIHNWKATKK